MGAFLLFRNSAVIDDTAVNKLLIVKGFKNPKIFSWREYCLWLFPKIFTNSFNYCVNGDNAVFCTGTVVYKNNDYANSLKNILSDFERNSIFIYSP